MCIRDRIILGCTDGLLCEELREYLYVLDIDYPDREELRQILYDACEQCAGRASGLEPAVADDLAEVLRGIDVYKRQGHTDIHP